MAGQIINGETRDIGGDRIMHYSRDPNPQYGRSTPMCMFGEGSCTDIIRRVDCSACLAELLSYLYEYLEHRISPIAMVPSSSRKSLKERVLG